MGIKKRPKKQTGLELEPIEVTELWETAVIVTTELAAAGYCPNERLAIYLNLLSNALGCNGLTDGHRECIVAALTAFLRTEEALMVGEDE